MVTKKPKRVFEYCPVEIQKRMFMKRNVLNSLEEHAGTPEGVVKTFPILTKRLVDGYRILQNIAREYELNVENSNEINKYRDILKN